MLPQIVSRESFQKAVTFLTTIQQLAMALGPTFAGFAIAALGLHGSYVIQCGLVLVSLVALALVEMRFERAAPRPFSLTLIKEGLVFVRGQRILLGAMGLDMFAVIFGGAQAMLPIYAQDILKVGPEGYGLLSSAQNVGASASAFLMLMLPSIRRTGRALLLAVSGFGLCTILFGLSDSLPLSILLYGFTGMSDQVSVVLRQTMIQMSTPDELRGRVSSVNQVFIGASNHLGMVESGLVAAATSAVFSVVSGGVACLVTVGLVAWKIPEMVTYELGNRPAPGHAHSARPAPVGAGKATG
jgi:MFS family permease